MRDADSPFFAGTFLRWQSEKSCFVARVRGLHDTLGGVA